MSFASFDVVVVPFPYADRLAEKRRPAIVVSDSALEAQYGLVWVAMVTSASNKGWQGDIAISDLKAAGLPTASIIRPGKIATVDAGRILRSIGHLRAADIRIVKERIRAFIAL
jgi:mRNA interferase MazF